MYSIERWFVKFHTLKKHLDVCWLGPYYISSASLSMFCNSIQSFTFYLVNNQHKINHYIWFKKQPTLFKERNLGSLGRRNELNFQQFSLYWNYRDHLLVLHPLLHTSKAFKKLRHFEIALTKPHKMSPWFFQHKPSFSLQQARTISVIAKFHKTSTWVQHESKNNACQLKDAMLNDLWFE